MTTGDAADEPVMALADLGAVAPEAWPELKFTPHPSVTRKDFTTNVQAVWQAINDETDPPQLEELDEPDRVIFFRQDMRTMYRSMDYEEAMLWDEMAKGLDFSGLCELSATYATEEEASMRVAGYLKGWIESSMLKA